MSVDPAAFVSFIELDLITDHWFDNSYKMIKQVIRIIFRIFCKNDLLRILLSSNKVNCNFDFHKYLIFIKSTQHL